METYRAVRTGSPLAVEGMESSLALPGEISLRHGVFRWAFPNLAFICTMMNCRRAICGIS